MLLATSPPNFTCQPLINPGSFLKGQLGQTSCFIIHCSVLFLEKCPCNVNSVSSCIKPILLHPRQKTNIFYSFFCAVRFETTEIGVPLHFLASPLYLGWNTSVRLADTCATYYLLDICCNIYHWSCH